MKTNLDMSSVSPSHAMISLIVMYALLSVIVHLNIKVSLWIDKVQKIVVLLFAGAGAPLFFFTDQSGPFWLSIWGAFTQNILWADQNEIRYWFILSSLAVFALLCARWGTLYLS